MEFGIFDSFDLGTSSPGELLEARLKFAAEAERAGVDRYHVTEHHGTPVSVCPSPNLFLAALTQRTSTMRIGALVNVLPAYDPFRLAEEIATLDQLSGGRVDFGIGAGVSPYELATFGVEMAEAKAIYAESVQAVTSALRDGRMDHDGKFLRSYSAELSVLPVQRPYPPLWRASNTITTAEWAGRNSVNLVGIWANGSFVDVVDAYRAARVNSPDDGTRLNPHVPDPLIGIKGTVVIAPSQAQADDLYGRASELFHRRLLTLWHANGNHNLDTVFSAAQQLAGGSACVGTAGTVRDQIVDQVERSGVNYYESSFYFGDMSLADALDNVRTFMTEVAPAVRAVAGR